VAGIRRPARRGFLSDQHNFVFVGGWARLGAGNWRLNLNTEHELTVGSTMRDPRHRQVRLLPRPARTRPTCAAERTTICRGLASASGARAMQRPGRRAAADATLQLSRLQLACRAPPPQRPATRCGWAGREQATNIRGGSLSLEQVDASLRGLDGITRDFTCSSSPAAAAPTYTDESVPAPRTCGLACDCGGGSAGTWGSPEQRSHAHLAGSVNAVLRWEYRPGSTHVLVYTHTILSTRGPLRPVAGWPRALGPTSADNALLLKLTYLCGAVKPPRHHSGGASGRRQVGGALSGGSRMTTSEHTTKCSQGGGRCRAVVCAGGHPRSARGCGRAPATKKVYRQGKTPVFGAVSYGKQPLSWPGVAPHFPGDIQAHTKPSSTRSEEAQDCGSSMEKCSSSTCTSRLKDYRRHVTRSSRWFGEDPPCATTIADAGGSPATRWRDRRHRLS